MPGFPALLRDVPTGKRDVPPPQEPGQSSGKCPSLPGTLCPHLHGAQSPTFLEPTSPERLFLSTQTAVPPSHTSLPTPCCLSPPSSCTVLHTHITHVTFSLCQPLPPGGGNLCDSSDVAALQDPQDVAHSRKWHTVGMQQSVLN